MRELVDAGIFLPRLFAVYHETQAHFSHHVEYDEEKDIPIALRKLAAQRRRNPNLAYLSLRMLPLQLSDLVGNQMFTCEYLVLAR